MDPVSNFYPIQDPRVFAYCFKRPHFTRRVLEDVFRQKVTGLSASGVGIFEYERVDGTMGYSAHISGIKLGTDEEFVTVIVQRDFSPVAHFTARQVDCNFHPDCTTETVYIITFVDELPTTPNIGPLLKFTMRDLMSHTLADKRWEYFICCKFAEKFSQSFLRAVCKLTRGEEYKTDDALLIIDTSWGAAADIHSEDELRDKQFEEQSAKLDEGAQIIDDGENVASEPAETLDSAAAPGGEGETPQPNPESSSDKPDETDGGMPTAGLTAEETSAYEVSGSGEGESSQEEVSSPETEKAATSV